MLPVVKGVVDLNRCRNIVSKRLYLFVVYLKPLQPATPPIAFDGTSASRPAITVLSRTQDVLRSVRMTRGSPKLSIGRLKR